MPDLPSTERAGLWIRILSSASAFYRASLAAVGVTDAPPSQPGASSGRVASKVLAQDYLQQMAQSAVVYAALNRRAHAFGNYPIAVYRDEVKVDPKREPWAAEFLALVQNPDPADGLLAGDTDGLAPIMPGEGLFAQLVADYLATGVAYVIPTAGSGDRLSGLTRAHPRSMTLEQGGAVWVYRPPGGGMARTYPRRAVFCIRNISWEAGGAGELGTGAGQVLADLVNAEATAIRKTAQVIEQGGADVWVGATTPAAAQFLANPANRNKVRDDLTEALAMRDGSRVVVMGGDLEAKDVGLKPADMQAPELMTTARGAELLALGVTPVSIGGEAGNYAEAALQYRVQAEFDESLAAVFEAFLLRPLSQHYARIGSGRRKVDARTVTARFDLSTHPGYAYARTEAIDRMIKLVDLGWDAEQAASIENLSLPKPSGPPRQKQAPVAAPGVPGNEPPPVGRENDKRVVFLPTARASRSPEDDIPASGVGTGRRAAPDA